ncbi:hypothetical protein [Lyngbya aestuarii]|uniref:hypothetical protein n=1 Tax=Lyngbya aestuarii TaxID=118322 RepID=UPI00058BF86C|nr:hypothetical protein [Lyngbya aestuarii]
MNLSNVLKQSTLTTITILAVAFPQTEMMMTNFSLVGNLAYHLDDSLELDNKQFDVLNQESGTIKSVENKDPKSPPSRGDSKPENQR